MMKTMHAGPGSPEQDEVMILHELIRAATADYVTGHADPRHAMALLMSVLPSYSGTLFATLQFMGEVTQGDTARMAKLITKNFREGIKVGLTRATRLARDEGYMGAPN